MSNKHYISLGICALIIAISVLSFSTYLKDYVFPRSYVIGSVNVDTDYKKYEIDDYFKSEDILFCKNLNYSTFVADEYGLLNYKYRFDSVNFNGKDLDYNLFVNDSYISTNSESGLIDGFHYINYHDVYGDVCSSAILFVHFEFYSSYSELSLTYSGEVAYFNKYLQSNDLVITLVKSSFEKGNIDEIYVGTDSVSVTIDNSMDVDFHYDFNDNWMDYDKTLLAGESITLDLNSFERLYFNVPTGYKVMISSDGTYRFLDIETSYTHVVYVEPDCTFLNMVLLPQDVQIV